jgi:hypothetical protein
VNHAVETLHKLLVEKDKEIVGLKEVINELCGSCNSKRTRIHRLEYLLVLERAKQFDVDEPCPARTRYEYCEIIDGICNGYPMMWEECPRKEEKLCAAREELREEEAI